jgi:hypothetical protein
MTDDMEEDEELRARINAQKRLTFGDQTNVGTRDGNASRVAGIVNQLEPGSMRRMQEREHRENFSILKEQRRTRITTHKIYRRLPMRGMSGSNETPKLQRSCSSKGYGCDDACEYPEAP